MTITELADLPLTQRLQSMEVLWASLERDSNKAGVIPDWHASVVSERLSAHLSGAEAPSSWSDAKSRLHAMMEAQKNLTPQDKRGTTK